MAKESDPQIMHKSPTTDGIKEYTLDSWKELFMLSNDVFSTAPAFVYRGQANYEWKLQSSLDRLQQPLGKLHVRGLFRNAKRLVRNRTLNALNANRIQFVYGTRRIA